LRLRSKEGTVSLPDISYISFLIGTTKKIFTRDHIFFAKLFYYKSQSNDQASVFFSIGRAISITYQKRNAIR